MNVYIDLAVRVLKYLSGLLALAALALTTYQIFAQIFYPPGMRTWIYEVFIYLLVWALLLTAPALTAEGKHIRVDSLFPVLSKRSTLYVEIVGCLISLTFCVAITWYGYVITYDAWDIGERSVSSLRFPKWMYYAALPVSFFMMSVFYVIRLVMLISGRHVPGMGTEHSSSEDEGKPA